MARFKLPVLIVIGILLIGSYGCGKSQEGHADNKQSEGQATRAKKENEYFMGQDGAPMVKIPAGKFVMGSNDGDPDEKPMHTVYLDAFYIDVYEVTNARYKKFMDATGHKAPKYWKDSKFNAPDQPVVGVSWQDAKAYSKWADKRLLTEAEWEKAARGKLVREDYPWGYKISHDDANYKGTGIKDRWERPAPAGSFLPNGYGLYNVAGNVYEWCEDWYSKDYYVGASKENPEGPASGKYRILRGGSWSSLPHALRVSDRYSAASQEPNIGFRCAKDVTP